MQTENVKLYKMPRGEKNRGRWMTALLLHNRTYGNTRARRCCRALSPRLNGKSAVHQQINFGAKHECSRSIVENCPIGDAIRRNKASEVHKFGVRLMPERYSKRRAPNERPLGWDPKFALSRCHAEMHNRMLNTRPRTHSVSVSKTNSCAVKLSLVVERARYNSSRSRRQSG